jgi:hypothetical protein
MKNDQMVNIHPRHAVTKTETTIASGAEWAAMNVSSDI